MQEIVIANYEQGELKIRKLGEEQCLLELNGNIVTIFNVEKELKEMPEFFKIAYDKLKKEEVIDCENWRKNIAEIQARSKDAKLEPREIKFTRTEDGKYDLEVIMHDEETKANFRIESKVDTVFKMHITKEGSGDDKTSHITYFTVSNTIVNENQELIKYIIMEEDK